MNSVDQEARDALRNALAAIAAADEKAIAAGYGSMVRGAVEEARWEIQYALRLVEGRA